MPSYFYNLALELFARPQSDLRGASQSKRPRSSNPPHRISRHPLNGKHRRSPPASSTSSDTAISPAHLTTPPYAKSSTGATEFENDLRLDKVSIECIDMIPSDPGTVGAKRTGWRDSRDNPVATGIGTDILGGLRTRGRYIPLDQTTSESVWGIVHLYRDAQETPYLTEEEYPSYLKGSAAARQPFDELGETSAPRQDTRADEPSSLSSLPQDEDYTTLCILAVPSYMSPLDFLGFVGEATRDDVSHFRMIRTARANRYMVLMKFRSGKKAREWQKDWNGKVFNSMEASVLFFPFPPYCGLVVVVVVS
ncbi:hypothetical protein EYZ11_012349 [Aspergillus tanneri]|uniref:BRCA1-associated 2/ETP1 RRM domain-containing protein n=1 Tax=Aspergillus tanneri TaxID=1220188 RepID=A0A4S3J0R3_9EURO|nr:hypothetical protein EYZ11_012349 [Aspergillus tanneri]